MNTKLAITGLGMVTSVGYDTVTACASIRAGLKKYSESPVSTLDFHELENVPIITSALDGLTDGYVGAGLYGRILNIALTDLMESSGIQNFSPEFLKNTCFILCLSPVRDYEKLAPDIDLEQLKKILSLKVSGGQYSVSIDICMLGHASLLLELEKIQERIAKNEFQHAILIGIDSLVGKEEIAFYSGHNRLKTDDNPDGFIPGEAGVAIMVEEPKAAQARGANIEAYISNVFSIAGENKSFVGQRNGGSALASVVINSLNDFPNVKSYYCDLNGESARAREWGWAIPAIQMQCGYVPEHMMVPAESLGDTGAASGGISICAITRSYARHYSQSDSTLVWSSSDDGTVASAIIHK